MKNELYVSTGAFIGRLNGKSPDGFLACHSLFPCDGFEFMMYDTWYDDLSRIVDRFLKSGEKFPTFHADKLIGEGFSSGTKEDADSAYRRFEANCWAAKELGSKTVIFHLWNGKPSDFKIGNHIEAIPKLTEIANRYGVTLTVENVVCADKDPMVHLKTISETYPETKFTFDTKMAAFHGQMEDICSLTYRYLWTSGAIAHIHLNDYGGGYRDFSGLRVLHLGEGHINFAPFISLLKEVGYTAGITLECSCMEPDGSLTPNQMLGSIAKAREMLKD